MTGRNSLQPHRFCYLCKSRDIVEIHHRCRDSEDVRVNRCTECGLVFLDDTRKISDDFYENSGMYEFAVPDRQALMKEERADTERRVAGLLSRVKGKRYLDFGCGVGAVAKELKAICSEIGVVELNKIHREAIEKEFGIPARRSISEFSGQFDVISLFHVLEHLKNPIAELVAIKPKLSAGGCVVVEVPHALDALMSLYGLESFKDFTYWTCHLFLFSEQTLSTALKNAGFSRVEIRYVQRFPLANHLYWLAEGKPHGHKIWKDIGSPALDRAYEQRLIELKATDTIMAMAWVD